MSTQNLGLYRSNLARVGLSALAMLFTVVISNPALAQTIVATIPAVEGRAVAVNAVTNKGYVADCKPESGIGAKPVAGTVAVIDGSTYTTTAITVGVCPTAMTVNPVTNKIYVANFGFISLTCGSCFNFGGITIIDGATNAASSVADPNARYPTAIAVNSATNKIYVANAGTSNITVIDGDTNSVTTVSNPNAGGSGGFTRAPNTVAVNEATNKIYVANGSAGNVTVIDGVTNSTTTVTDPNAIAPVAVAVNAITNKIYVANEGDYPESNYGNVTVIDGVTNTTTTITDPNALRPIGVAVDPVTNMIYVVNQDGPALNENGSVTVINGATNSFVSVQDRNAIYPSAVAVDPVTNEIYVANQGDWNPNTNPNGNKGSVTAIDGATNSFVTIIDPNANDPYAVAVDSVTSMVYVANWASGDVTVINETVVPSDVILSVLTAGNGSGTVTSNPPGINCSTSCSASFPSESTVTLTASPDSGYFFSGWSGACSGTGACSATMKGAEFVTANFNSSPPSDFSLSLASTGLNLKPGGQATDTITIASLNGSFASAIQLSCTVTGSTPLATCSLSSTSVTPGPNSVTSTLTVTAPSQSAQLKLPSEGQLSRPFFAVFLPIPLALIGLGLAKSKNRRRSCWLLCSLFLAFVALQAGCGGGSSNQLTPPPLNYTVTVTATSGTIQHTTQVTVTVQ